MWRFVFTQQCINGYINNEWLNSLHQTRIQRHSTLEAVATGYIPPNPGLKYFPLAPATAMPEAMPKTLLALSIYLIVITALVRLGSSLYLPAMPRMGIELQLSSQQLAFTMTAYLAAFAGASILMGPLCDHWGRRVLILGGIAIFFAGTLFCAVAQGYGLLLTGRLLQAVGGSAIPVATRAMTRDAFHDHQIIGILGWIGSITGLIPLLAPVLGGLLTQGFGWRANFYLLTAITLAIGLYACLQTPETLPHDKRTPFKAAETLRAYASMLVTPKFLAPLTPVMLCFAIQGAYMVSSPIIFIKLLHLTPALFGATSLALVGAILGGRFVCMALLKRWGVYPAYLGGSLLTFLGGALLLGFLLGRQISVLTILAPSTLYCLGFGTLLPIGIKAGLSAFPKRVGTASALLGCLTLGATALGSAVLGVLMKHSERAIEAFTLVTFVGVTFILVSSWLCRRSVS
ncbi:MAG TPA: hypothetical protein DCZ95_02430 [Verrucomicrobia bacterium]|nr:MAG: hypothetical protein A2X46_00420 [Lentisphaerae bacterium GWF2_57_35]HBA82929.1 hypothetical protein [Verrucomicrobiota bacterium]